MQIKYLSCCILFLAAMSQAASADDDVKNLGMVGIQTPQGRYLQAHDDNGQTHASNEHRNEEETWFLYCVDEKKHLYALMNWRNGKFLSKIRPFKIPEPYNATISNLAVAYSKVISPNEEWEMISGKPYGVLNAVAFKSVFDGTYLQTNPPGKDVPFGGEVFAGSKNEPPKNDGTWSGWWVMSAADTPQPGKDFWNTVGGTVEALGKQVVNVIKPADVTSLIKLLGG